MCFAWSRMTVIHAAKKGGEERDKSLPFEGFLEALCRLAVIKALPTRAEMAAAGYERREDCGTYIAYVKENETSKWEEMIQRSVDWGEEPPQPLPECVGMLISLVEDCVESETRGVGDAAISKKEALEWVRNKVKCG